MLLSCDHAETIVWPEWICFLWLWTAFAIGLKMCVIHTNSILIRDYDIKWINSGEMACGLSCYLHVISKVEVPTCPSFLQHLTVISCLFVYPVNGLHTLYSLSFICDCFVSLFSGVYSPLSHRSSPFVCLHRMIDLCVSLTWQICVSPSHDRFVCLRHMIDLYLRRMTDLCVSVAWKICVSSSHDRFVSPSHERFVCLPRMTDLCVSVTW